MTGTDDAFSFGSAPCNGAQRRPIATVIPAAMTTASKPVASVRNTERVDHFPVTVCSEILPISLWCYVA